MGVGQRGEPGHKEASPVRLPRCGMDTGEFVQAPAALGWSCLDQGGARRGGALSLPSRDSLNWMQNCECSDNHTTALELRGALKLSGSLLLFRN